MRCHVLMVRGEARGNFFEGAALLRGVCWLLYNMLDIRGFCHHLQNVYRIIIIRAPCSFAREETVLVGMTGVFWAKKKMDVELVNQPVAPPPSPPPSPHACQFVLLSIFFYVGAPPRQQMNATADVVAVGSRSSWLSPRATPRRIRRWPRCCRRSGNMLYDSVVATVYYHYMTSYDKIAPFGNACY